MDYIPEKPKVVDEAHGSFKNLFKNHTTRETLIPIEEVKLRIEKVCDTVSNRSKNEFDPDLFLVNAKQSITNPLINRRQYKVKLILSCVLEKVDLKSGETIVKEVAFHSKTEVNLESTNSNELFSKMKETVLESLAKFQRQ